MKTQFYGDTVHVYYPIEDRIVKVVVSSSKNWMFTAKFLEDEEPTGLDLWNNYGQADNDIYYSMKSREPIDIRIKQYKP